MLYIVSDSIDNITVNYILYNMASEVTCPCCWWRSKSSYLYVWLLNGFAIICIMCYVMYFVCNKKIWCFCMFVLPSLFSDYFCGHKDHIWFLLFSVNIHTLVLHQIDIECRGTIAWIGNLYQSFTGILAYCILTVWVYKSTLLLYNV